MVISGNVSEMGDSVFSGCTGLTDIVISNSVTSIGANAFADCTGLTEIIIPGSVSTLGENAFAGCTNLIKSAYPSHYDNPFPSGIAIEYPKYDYLVKNGCLWNEAETKLYFVPTSAAGKFVIPEAVYLIGENAFTACSQLTAIAPASLAAPSDFANSFVGLYDDVTLELQPETLANYLKTDYWYLFKNIIVGDNPVETIADELFTYLINPDNSEAILTGVLDKSLTAVTVPAEKKGSDDTAHKVTTIGSAAFKDMTSMTSATFPNTLTSIYNESFSGCTGLTSVGLSESITTLGSSVFEGCTALTEVVLPNSLSSLGAGAFRGCTSVENVTLGTGLDYIPDFAFYGCESLADIVVPRNVLSIGESAFQGCSSLEEVAIGCGMQQIDILAFEGANDIAKVGSASVEAPNLSAGAFSVFDVPLYVPADGMESYMSGRGNPWLNFNIQTLVEITAVTINGIEEFETLPAATPIQLTATIEPADATLPYIFWSSTDTALATVDSQGVLVINSSFAEPSYPGDTSTHECQIIAETLYEGAPAAIVTITDDIVTSIKTIYSDPQLEGTTPERSNDIYNMQGVLLKRNASQADIDALAPGFYIVGDKKLIIR